jgi:cell wall-associated NlpC family hydrolase
VIGKGSIKHSLVWWWFGAGFFLTAFLLLAIFGVVVAALGGSFTGCEAKSLPATVTGPTGPQPSTYALQSIPPERLRLYERAGRRYDIDWSFLASIGAQECNNESCSGANSAGCAGPMQIAYVRGSTCSPGSGPTLWERYGVSIHRGQAPNIDDPGDAIFTAARILKEDMSAPPTGGSYNEYREAACHYYGACSDSTVAYADEVMARAVEYGFDGSGSPAPSSPPLAQPPSEEPIDTCAASYFAESETGSAAIVRLAESQVGQAEHPEGSDCTRYGPCEKWCSLFVAWIWQHTGVPLPGTPADYAYSGSIYTWIQEQHGQVLPATARPSPGDAVFYGNGPGSSAHVGIVVRILTNGQIVTVEGNYHHHVSRIGPFPPNSPIGEAGPIYGYAQPPATTPPNAGETKR